MFGRTTVLIALALALALPASAPARQTASLKAPIGLRAFLLRYDEPTSRSFSRTPSFGWKPTSQAKGYEFQLATASSFRENSMIWGASGLTTPVVSVPLALPWITGKPYSLFARVRANTQRGMTRWSNGFGFNVRWDQIPAQLSAPTGLLRWAPVSGANAYEVWEKNITGSGSAVPQDKLYFVTTNVTDMRDWYTLHQDSSWTGVAKWRVRAVRVTYGSTLNGSNGASYGPWSPIYTTTNANSVPTAGPIALGGTVSDVAATVTASKAHKLMPGFYWNGTRSLTGQSVELYRAYVFSDRDCLNPVYTGAVVGSPAWVPRMSGTLALPQTLADVATSRTAVLTDGTEQSVFSADGESVVATEGVAATSASSGSSTLKAPWPFEKGVVLDLLDRAWPSGGYYWTVLPVAMVVKSAKHASLDAAAKAGDTTVTIAGATLAPGDQISISGETGLVVVSATGKTVTLNQGLALGHPAGEVVIVLSKLEYDETELAQEACASGRVAMFGKVSQPVAAGGKTPYVTGLGPNGSLQTANATRSPKVYGIPLVAWRPALGADGYEVQWSKKADPFEAVYQEFTYSTSATLSQPDGGPLKPGAWYYRVRGIDFKLSTNARAMAWSSVRKIRMMKPVFRLMK